MANHVIGAEIRLEGEKDFKRAVSSINTDLKVLGSELKKTESEYKGNENSLSALTAKSEQFTKIAEAQRKKVEILQTAVEKSRAKYTAAGENVEKYRKELSDAQGELERLKGSENATTQEVQEQEKAVAELAKKLATAEKGYATAEKQTKNWEVSLNRAEAELNDTERKLGETNKALREMGTSSRYTKGQIEAAESTLSEFGRKAQPIADGFKAAFKTVLAVSATAAGASAAVIKKSVDIGSDFESQMSKVKAISGATQSEMEQLTAKAKEMGGTTKFTAKQAGEALEYMSMAGWKAADMLGGIGGIMNLAAASGEDLGRTSDIVTDALTAFGMKAADAGHFADVLAAASSHANTNVGMMGETFKYVGAMAGTLGYSAEDVGLSIGLMANAGIKASQAGTELNAIYTRLSVNTSHARDAIEGLGISFYDSNGSARSWGTILDEMRIKTAKMTDAEKTAFANRVAGQRAQAGLLAMLGATSADYDKLTKSINNADGAAQRMADTMQDNLQGQLTIFKSGLEGTAITIYEEMQKPLTEGMKTAVSTLNDPRIQSGVKAVGKQFGEMFAGGAKLAAKYAPDFIKGFQKITGYLSSSSFKSTVKSGGELLMNTGKVAVDLGKVALPALTKGTELLAKSGKVLVPVLAAGYTGFKALQIVKTTTELIQFASGAFQALNVVMMANPWVLAIGGIAAATVALVGIAATSSEAEDKYKDLKQEIDETAESMKEMAKARQESYENEYKEIHQVEVLKDRLSELVDKNGKLKGSKEELKRVVEKLNENGFNVELNKTGDLITNYKNLNKEIDEYLEKKKYQAKADALDSEYKAFRVKWDSGEYYKETLKSRKAYNEYIKDFEKSEFNFKDSLTDEGLDASKLFDSKGEKTDYYYEYYSKVQSQEGGMQKAKGFEKRADELAELIAAYQKNIKSEENAKKLIDAVEKADFLAAQGKYAEANKVLQAFFDDRNKMLKKAADYEKNEREKAIDELGNQLQEEVDAHRLYQEMGSKELIEMSVEHIRQAAEELKKVGIEIPDSIAEGLEAGTLTVDQAMAQIEQILRNGGKVDLMEEGKFSADTYIDGFETKEDEAETAGKGLVNSTLAPLKSSKTEAGAAGVDAEKAFIGPIYRAVGEGEKAGKELADSTLSPLKSSKAEARKAGEDEGNGFIGPIYHAAGEGEKAGKKLAKSSLVPLKLAKSEAMEAGKSVGGAFGAGIPKGIDQYVPDIKSSAVNAVNVALAAARKAADIHSPSKKSSELVGMPMGEGVGVGFEKGAAKAAWKAAAATNAMIEKMRSASSAAAARLSDNSASGSFGSSVTVGGGSNKTINIRFDNTFHSASTRDGEALLRQLDRALGAKI